MKIIKKYIGKIISGLGNRGYFHNMSDEKYLNLIFPAFLGYDLDITNPKTLNEKLQWLKIHNRKPEYVNWVDKYAVRNYAKSVMGENSIIPIVGGPWSTFRQIDFKLLPKEFVLKCTHDSQSVYICRDKNSIDYKKLEEKYNKRLSSNLYYGAREWPYKYVKPQIIAEKYMVDESGLELKDYKFYCFNGEPRLIQVNFGRFNDPGKNVYDCNWNYIHITSHFPTYPELEIMQPKSFEIMKNYARIFSKGQPFLRVDFYEINEKPYFGELTFFPGSGLMAYDPVEWDLKMGEWVDLSLIEE